jgi:hypothetical protein
MRKLIYAFIFFHFQLGFLGAQDFHGFLKKQVNKLVMIEAGITKKETPAFIIGTVYGDSTDVFVYEGNGIYEGLDSKSLFKLGSGTLFLVSLGLHHYIPEDLVIPIKELQNSDIFPECLQSYTITDILTCDAPTKIFPEKIDHKNRKIPKYEDFTFQDLDGLRNEICLYDEINDKYCFPSSSLILINEWLKKTYQTDITKVIASLPLKDQAGIGTPKFFGEEKPIPYHMFDVMLGGYSSALGMHELMKFMMYNPGITKNLTSRNREIGNNWNQGIGINYQVQEGKTNLLFQGLSKKYFTSFQMDTQKNVGVFILSASGYPLNKLQNSIFEYLISQKK